MCRLRQFRGEQYLWWQVAEYTFDNSDWLAASRTLEKEIQQNKDQLSKLVMELTDEPAEKSEIRNQKSESNLNDE